MIKNKDNNSLKQAILSIVASVLPWTAMFINAQIINIMSEQFRVPDIVQILMILVPFLFTYIGVELAVQAKKNNYSNKKNVACISVVSVIIASFNTFFIFPVGIAMVMAFMNQRLTIELSGISILFALTNSIFFIVIYALAKPKT